MGLVAKRLEEANHGYLRNPLHVSSEEEAKLRGELSKGQHPHTMVLSCADSRVPVERILNGKMGDYFVVRSAGNVAEASQIASLEFGAAVLGAEVLLVLGHTSCGAVAAAVDVVKEKAELPSHHLTKLAEMIVPAVAFASDGKDLNKADCIAESTKENVRLQIRTLKEQSKILRDKVSNNELEVVGGVYDIASGEISFIDL